MALRDIESRSPAARGLQSALSRGRLAHAYIFGGPEGSAKVEAARELARAVLCDSPEDGDAIPTSRSSAPRKERPVTRCGRFVRRSGRGRISDRPEVPRGS